MLLPFDNARCANRDCLLSCRRKEPGHPTYQNIIMFLGGDDCRGLIAPMPKEVD